MNDTQGYTPNTSGPTRSAPIPLTRWYKHGTHEPGQPGVFAVDDLVLDDSGKSVPRYSYWNGKDFGPVMLHAYSAYGNRFGARRSPVTVFRGYTEQVAA